MLMCLAPWVLQTVRDALVSERQRMYEALQHIPFLQPFPSEANFILCRVTGGKDAKAVKDTLAAEHGIMVRHYAKAELAGFIRISVGRPEHTDAVVAALQRMADPGMAAAAANGSGVQGRQEPVAVGKE